MLNMLKIGGGEFLDKNFAQCLKGIACLIIALHHYSQYIVAHQLSDHVIYKLLSYQGGFAGVALFFFLSGFGLMESEKRCHLGIKGFLLNRYWKVYKPILIINAISIIVYSLFHLIEVRNVQDILYYLLSIKAFGSVTWFVSVLFVCYGIFYIASTQKKRTGIILFIGLFCMMLYSILKYADSYYFYFSTPLFFVGVFVSIYKDIVQRFFTLYNGVVCMGIIVILTAFYLFRMMGYGLGEHLMLNIVQTVLLLWFSSHFLLKINYHSFLGKISYELYLTHYRIIAIAFAVFGGISVWMYLPIIILVAWGIHLICTISWKTGNHFKDIMGCR